MEKNLQHCSIILAVLAIVLCSEHVPCDAPSLSILGVVFIRSNSALESGERSSVSTRNFLVASRKRARPLGPGERKVAGLRRLRVKADAIGPKFGRYYWTSPRLPLEWDCPGRS